MKPSIPRGTRDFGSADMRKRNYIFSIIRKNFELFGYEPIETPSMENIATLTGKYGEEGDQLIFKILNSRLHESKKKDLLQSEFEKTLKSAYNSDELTGKALRYDLTVPFARYVVMNRHLLTFPFKRFQIQPVWRADAPQRGRYREFYQCDADVIGSDSLVNELDLIGLIDKSFYELKVPVLLKFNNRKILSAIAEIVNYPDKIVEITVAIDKLDKIGKEGVVKELTVNGISNDAIAKLEPLIDFKGNNAEKIEILRRFVGNNATGLKGVEELEYLLNNSSGQIHHASLELDITLARGLNYYTGTIFECKANAGTFTPSILGGGRYDDLTGVFGLKDMSGVGISFGIDRIFDVMEELQLFPDSIQAQSTTQILFANFGGNEERYCMQLIKRLRDNGIACELYPDAKKMQKQFEFADKKKIPFVCIAGSQEIESGLLGLKELKTGTQEKLSPDQLVEKFKV